MTNTPGSPAAVGLASTARDYLARSLHARGEKYENYVINRVWHQLNDLELKPVTQQYVDRGDGSFALLDLYFPQLSVGIECDEAQHLKVVDADLARTQDVTTSINMDQKVGSVRAQHIAQIERVDATRDIESIHRRIDEIVELLRARRSSVTGFEPWDPEASDALRAIERQRINVADNYFFPTNKTVRPIFGLSETSVQRALYRAARGSETRLWFIRLVGRGGASTASTGIENHVSTDWTEIYERAAFNAEPLPTNAEQFDRIVFARSRNSLGEAGYRFLGVFRKMGTMKQLDSGAPFVVHERRSDALDLSDYLN